MPHTHARRYLLSRWLLPLVPFRMVEPALLLILFAMARGRRINPAACRRSNCVRLAAPCPHIRVVALPSRRRVA
jgi:hypothetical protein